MIENEVLEHAVVAFWGPQGVTLALNQWRSFLNFTKVDLVIDLNHNLMDPTASSSDAIFYCISMSHVFLF